MTLRRKLAVIAGVYVIEGFPLGVFREVWPVDFRTQGLSLAAIGVHTLAMLSVTGLLAVIVHEWLGLAFLRRGWVNLDLLWILALAGSGGFLLLW